MSARFSPRSAADSPHAQNGDIWFNVARPLKKFVFNLSFFFFFCFANHQLLLFSIIFAFYVKNVFCILLKIYLDVFISWTLVQC